MSFNTDALAKQVAGINPVVAAAALASALHSRNEEMDELMRLPESTVVDLENARLFDMLVPNIHGGLQTSLTTYMDAVVQLGTGDGSTAWAVALLSMSSWLINVTYPKHVVDEIHRNEKPSRIAGSLLPRKVKTRRVDGGVVIEEGLWTFNSGVHHAHWDNLGIPLFNQAGTPVGMGSALIPTSQVTVLNDWDTMGLRGTGSTSVTVKDVFVPDERIGILGNILRGDYRAAHLRGEKLYQLPALPLMTINLVFPALGMAKAALKIFLERASGRGIAFTSYHKQNDAAVTHLQVGEASSKIDAAEAVLKGSIVELEACVAEAEQMTLVQRARIWRNAGFANQLIWEAVDMLARASGGSFVSVHNPMNRVWRDACVAGMHGGICTSTAMELFGGISLGKSSISPMLS